MATLDVYYETKCPFSQQFIDGEVKPALTDPMCVFKDVHINWVPYGNADEAGGFFFCQHGEDECFGNQMHLCAKQKFGSDEDGLNKWVTCHIEYLLADASHTAADLDGYRACAGANVDELATCADLKKDKALVEPLKQLGVETQAVHAEHMPWAIMGAGQPNLQGTLVQGLCQSYGAPGSALANAAKPACCQG